MHFVNITTCAEEESAPRPKRIDQISRFVSSFNRLLRSNPSKTIVVCVGRDCATSLTTAALLVGGFMILGRGMDVEEVKSAFKPFAGRFTSFGDRCDCARHTVQDCWLALHFANKLGWIDLSDEIKPGMDLLEFGSLDVDAYAHYAEAANGGIVTVVPQAILFFPSPVDLPGNAEWMDSADGKQRHFSPAFYADLLLTEFNVSTVMCVDSGDSSWKAFADRGIVMEDMPLGDSVSDLLRALDRLLAVTQDSPGAVALHSRPDAAAAMGRAGALIAAYLARSAGIPPDAAIAWVGMVHPCLLHSANLPSPLLDSVQYGGAFFPRRSESLAGGPRAREQDQDQDEDVQSAIRRAASLPFLPAVTSAPDGFDLS